MVCMREHVDRLHCHHFIVTIEQLEVACLCCRVTADIYNAAWCSKEYRINNILVHTGAWRVSDNDIGTSVLINEVACKYVLHVAGKECEVIEAV